MEAQLVERVPRVQRLCPRRRSPGSIPPFGPLLRIIPSLSPPFIDLSFSYSKESKKPKNIIKKREEKKFDLLFPILKGEARFFAHEAL